MIMWLFIMLGTVIASVAGLVYLITRVGKFEFVSRIAKDKKLYRNLLSTGIVFAVIMIIWWVLGYVNLCVVLIHLTLFWLFSELVFYILRKFSKKIAGSKLYLASIIALVFTILYLGYGFYNDRHVVVTNYTITTDKEVAPLRIVQFTDSHMGTTFDGEEFIKHVDTISSLNPDIVVITGDYIDGSSVYKDIITSTKALSKLSPTYGTYFIFGNHDKNYYGEEGRRDFSEEDFIKELTDNNVKVLEDEIVAFADGYTLIGRQDKTVADRASIEQLMSGVLPSDFVIDLNHQPNDYAAEEAAGVDLVLSGHTHGGQLIPIREAGVWMGANDKTYGYEKRSNTNFIVSSGISDWAIDFKTGCKSEIVVIDIGSSK